MTNDLSLDEFVAQLADRFRGTFLETSHETVSLMYDLEFAIRMLGDGGNSLFPEIGYLKPPFDAYDLASVEKLSTNVTSPRALRVFRRLMADHIKRGVPLPPAARPLARAIALGEPLPIRFHRSGTANEWRDLIIFDVLQSLVKLGLQLTRNRTQRTQVSACAIVSEKLNEVGIAITEDGVEKIWRRESSKPKPDPSWDELI